MRKFVLLTAVWALAAIPIASAQSPDDINKGGKEHAARAGDLPKGKPGPGMVWVNAKKKIYYRQGNAKYGKSKNGAYMSEGDAINRGYVDGSEPPIKPATSQ